MREIHLSSGKVALISDEDYPRASKLTWSDRGDGYVRARFKRSAGGDGYKIVFLHRFIMNPPDGLVVDHIDRNPLNNTRENLQIISQSQNCMRGKGGGVTLHRGRFRARARIHGTPRSLGVYLTREEAEAAVERARASAWAETGDVR